MDRQFERRGRERTAETDWVARDREARTWMADPHAYFKAFSGTARRFQQAHPSARLRVMTFVGRPEEFLSRRPVRVHLLDRTTPVRGWDDVLSAVVAAVVLARPSLVPALSRAGLMPWLVNLEPSVDLLEAFRRGRVTLRLASLEEAFRGAQWLMLMAGVRLNEALVQVDPYADDAAWKAREAALQAKRAEQKRILQEIDAARRQYAEDHPEETRPDAPRPDAPPDSDGYVF